MSKPRNTQKSTSSKPLAFRSKPSASESILDQLTNESALSSIPGAALPGVVASASSANRPQSSRSQESTLENQVAAKNVQVGHKEPALASTSEDTSSKRNDEILRAPEVFVDGFPSAGAAQEPIIEAIDSTTKVVSAYQFSSSRKSKDVPKDGGRDEPREVQIGSSKRIKETPGEMETNFPGHKRRDRSEFAEGVVFQMLHVPPDQLSSMTPFTTGLQKGNNTFIRRYAVIRDHARNSVDGFVALPIMTYEGHGVGKAGIKKHHHTIIYTRKQPPSPTAPEMPQRKSDGSPEDGMQTNPIRVVPREKGIALDPMARLNYGNPITFDYGVKVEFFGRVHASSMQDFLYQFLLVLRNHQHTAGYPTLSSISPRVSRLPSLTPVVSPTRSQIAATPAVPGPSTLAASHSRHDSGVGIGFEGPVTVEEVINVLNILRVSAEHQGMPLPPNLTDDGLRTMAQNHTVRKRYLDAYKAIWNLAQHARDQNQ